MVSRLYPQGRFENIHCYSDDAAISVTEEVHPQPVSRNKLTIPSDFKRRSFRP